MGKDNSRLYPEEVFERFVPKFAALLPSLKGRWLLTSKEDRLVHTYYGVEVDPGGGREHLTICKWGLAPFPGCCGILISTSAWVNYPYQKKGIGTLANHLRCEMAAGMGYTALICTDVIDNLPQARILSKRGWEHLYTFSNRRTGNEVGVHVFDLTKTDFYQELLAKRASLKALNTK